MALYELSVAGGAGTISVAQAELRAASTDAIYVYEVGVSLTAATASSIGLGRPANSGSVAGGTLAVGLGNDQDVAAAVGGIVTTGWTTAPTAPTNFFRRIGLPAAIGNGVIWTWPRGLRVKQGTSLVLWNITASSIANIHFVWEE
jgi:hypothetical protein